MNTLKKTASKQQKNGSTVPAPSPEVARLDRLIAGVRAKLEVERAGSTPTLDALETAAATLRQRAQRLEMQLERAKAQANRRKREIDEWKDWYHHVPEGEQASALDTLMREIERRTAQLESLTAQISEMTVAQAAVRSELDAATHRLDAFKAGVFDRSIDQDPRLAKLHEAREALMPPSQLTHDSCSK